VVQRVQEGSSAAEVTHKCETNLQKDNIGCENTRQKRRQMQHKAGLKDHTLKVCWDTRF
jgi:hypothetical protein